MITKKSFGDCVAEEGHEPTANAFIYTHSVLETSWALARDIFGDQARPEHAFEIFKYVDATNHGESDDACAFCEMPEEAHPGAACRVFVEEGEGCDNCGQHEDSHLDDALKGGCPGFNRENDDVVQPDGEDD